MTTKKAPSAPVAPATKDANGVPLGRPAFPSNLVPHTRDEARPAGAVEMVKSNAPPQAPGASTLTLMNPAPVVSGPKAPSPKKGG